MNFVSITHQKDGSVHLENTHGKRHLKIDDMCIIEPPNKQRKRNRGRVCLFKGVGYQRRSDGKVDYHYAKVYWLDTKRAGRADFDELAPYTPE